MLFPNLELRVSAPKLACFTCFLPFAAFIFCIAWSIIFNFDDTTRTHCKVPNYLPSISAAIGNKPTQQLVWSSLITLHAPFRLVFVILNRELFEHIVQLRYCYLVSFACFLNFVENVSLLGLTYVTSSTETYWIHEKCFLTFIATSELYMLLTCLILRYYRRLAPDRLQLQSLRLKMRLLLINAICFVLSGYFFVRHNSKCEPGVYTLFALFEYIVVLSNMAFHLTAIYDFHGKTIVFNEKGLDVR